MIKLNVCCYLWMSLLHQHLFWLLGAQPPAANSRDHGVMCPSPPFFSLNKWCWSYSCTSFTRLYSTKWNQSCLESSGIELLILNLKKISQLSSNFHLIVLHSPALTSPFPCSSKAGTWDRKRSVLARACPGSDGQTRPVFHVAALAVGMFEKHQPTEAETSLTK